MAVGLQGGLLLLSNLGGGEAITASMKQSPEGKAAYATAPNNFCHKH